MEPELEVFTVFEPVTGTWQYVVADPSNHEAVVIDPVLDFDPAHNRISTSSADKILALAEEHSFLITRIMETHAHADHLTASRYMQQQLMRNGLSRPDICIGKRILEVQITFAEKYGISYSELTDVFDHLFDDNETFEVGSIRGKVLHLPGHTPDHVGYQIGTNVFTGDSIFNPDVGSARCDFPGGSARDLFASTKTLLSLPGHFRLYTGHDYPPDSREAGESGEKPRAYTTVDEQRRENKHVRDGTSEEEFVAWRTERDASLAAPRLLNQAMQFNIRAGRLPKDGLLRIPVTGMEEVLENMRGFRKARLRESLTPPRSP